MHDCIMTEDIRDDEKEEGFGLLFGGLNSQDVSLAAWDNESQCEYQNSPGKLNADLSIVEKYASQPPRTISLSPCYSITSQSDAEGTFDYAFTSTGKFPVQVAEIPSKGKGLVACVPIRRGDVIFTEKAAIASQVPPVSVRACQMCFRSLEPVATLANRGCSMPRPDLWTVPELDFESTDKQFSRDRHGRVQCFRCGSFYCSEQCHSTFSKQIGCCCTLTHFFALHDEIESSLALAIRMFAMSIKQHREQIHCLRPWDGLCGESSEASQLELGEAIRQEDGIVRYSLEHLYNEICKAWGLGPSERRLLSLEYLERLASISARNGVGLITQSPFKSYYNALIRTSGRGSKCHAAYVQQVARALGAEDGVLHRGMDRMVDNLVAPEIAAVLPLTARINHSCNPNAEIHSQTFVDCHMDLVAKQDIAIGEEITISYIPVNRKPTSKRKRELYAKYLFDCNCIRCHEA